MMYYTHAAFGLLIALLALDFFNVHDKILFVLIVLLFSVFPDIDNTKSKIGKKNKLISGIINFIFGHRGLLHTIYVPLIMFFIFYNLNKEIGIAVLVGYLTHLLMDAITRAGIKPFYPLINKKINGFFKTGSFIEKIFFLVIVFLNLYILWNYI
ncbi:MAG: metal-dependent hydrolase [Candidatus Woesearchaeota archaeon]